MSRFAIPALPASIFKAYDIRGIVDDTLTPDVVRAVGLGLGTLAREQGVKAIAVGRDGRLSGPGLSHALQEGIVAAGVDAIDVGCVPTPVTYFAGFQLETYSCVSVTGSHNPPDYNGLKMVIAGNTLAGDAIQALKQRIEAGDVHWADQPGVMKTADVKSAYLDKIVGDVKLARPMTIAVDCGNGVAGELAPELFKRMGCKIIPMYCEIDGTFPNHHPDPSKPENLQDLVAELKKTDAEIGLAFDGDGDRLGVVTKDGEVIFPDRQMMLFAQDVLSRCPGAPIIFDVKCSRLLGDAIRAAGGQPLILLEILSRAADANPVLKHLPNSQSTPELNISMKEGEPHALMAELAVAPDFPGARDVITIDGLRVEYADGFGLARPSNTTPVVVLRFEADTPEALSRIQGEFRRVLNKARPDLALPF